MWKIYNKDSNLNLFPLHLYHDECAHNLDKLIGKNLKNIGIFVKNEEVFSLCEEDEWDLFGKTINELLFDPQFTKLICDKIDSDGLRATNFYNKTKSIDTKNISLQELENIFNEYTGIIKDLYQSASVINIVEHGGNENITKTITSILKQHFPADAIANYFNIITTPLESTFSNIAQQKLLEISHLIRQESFLLEEYTIGAYEKFNKYPNIIKVIEEYESEYDWITYGVQGPKSTRESLIDRLIYLAHHGTDPQSKIQQTQTDHEILAKKQNEIKKLLSEKESLFINNSITLLLYKVYRKEYQTKAHYAFDRIIELLAKQFKTTIQGIRLFTAQEILDMVRTQTYSVEEYKKRSNGILYLYIDGQLTILSGNDAEEKFNSLTNNINNRPKTILTGMSIYRGKARGRVKIIHSLQDIDSVQKNDIVITYTTSPQYTKIFNMISGLITEQGGLTSHAAIVAREFKLPCIVGIRNVMSIFQDGDEIEINSFDGTVRKL